MSHPRINHLPFNKNTTKQHITPHLSFLASGASKKSMRVWPKRKLSVFSHFTFVHHTTTFDIVARQRKIAFLSKPKIVVEISSRWTRFITGSVLHTSTVVRQASQVSNIQMTEGCECLPTFQIQIGIFQNCSSANETSCRKSCRAKGDHTCSASKERWRCRGLSVCLSQHDQPCWQLMNCSTSATHLIHRKWKSKRSNLISHNIEQSAMVGW